MVIVCAILLAMITTGTKAELGQDCKYVQEVEIDKYGNTTKSQRYECKTAPREVINKTEIVKVQSCLKKVLFGVDCHPWEPEGDEISKVISTVFSMGILN